MPDTRKSRKNRIIAGSELVKHTELRDRDPSAQYSMHPAMWIGSRCRARWRPSSCDAFRASRGTLTIVACYTEAVSAIVGKQ